MGNDVQFGNLARTNAKKPEYKEKLQQAAKEVSNRKTSGSVNASSVTQHSAVNIQGSSNLNVRDNSIFGDKGGVDAKDFSEMWTKSATAENLTEAQKNTLKAQNDLLTALADEDGDGMITQEEAERLDVASDDGVITDEDIQEIYKSLNISPDDATIDDLLNAINGILDDAAIEEVEDLKNKEAAKEQGINLDNSGVVEHVDDKTGEKTYTVEVEAWGTQADGRAANDCLSRIISNAYPESSAEERQAIQNQICQMNNINNPNVISTGANLKLPVIERGENGEIKFSESAAATEEKPTDSKYAIPEEGTLETKQGTVSKDEDGKYTITLQNGVEVSCVYDESTGEVTIPNAEKSDKPGTYGYSYSVEMRNGEKVTVEPDKGKYYINGVQVDGVKMDENGNLSFQTDIAEKAAEEKTNDYSINHTGSASGSGKAADGSTVTWQEGKYYVDGHQVDYDEKTGVINGDKYKINHTGSASGEGVAADGTSVTWNQGKYYDENGNQINYDERTGLKTPIEKSTTTTSSTSSTTSTASTSSTTSTAATTGSRLEEDKQEIISALDAGQDPNEVKLWVGTILADDNVSAADKADIYMSYMEHCVKNDPYALGQDYTNFPGTGAALLDGMIQEGADIDSIIDYAERYQDAYNSSIYMNDMYAGSFDGDKYAEDLIGLYSKATPEQFKALANSLDTDKNILTSQEIADLYINAGDKLDTVLSVYDTQMYQDGVSGKTETALDQKLFENMLGNVEAINYDDLPVSMRSYALQVSDDNIQQIMDSTCTDAEKVALLQRMMSNDPAKFADAFRDFSSGNQEKYMEKFMNMMARYNKTV